MEFAFVQDAVTPTDNKTTLAEAYRRTAYTVDLDEGSFAIRIGEKSEEADALLRQSGRESWAFITACNPRSGPLAPEKNHLRQEELRNYLRTTDYRVFPGRGVGENADWPPEESFLVLGISREAAIRLGTMLEQIAIVVGEQGFAAELVCCPLPET